MLVIRTYLDRSPIHGVGIFTSEFVKKGTRIWEHHPLMDFKLTPEQLNELPEPAREFVEIVAVPYPFGADNYWLSLDNCNYMNHSDTPNTEGLVIGVANVDIPKDTELTVDYYKVDHRTKEYGN